MKVDAILIFFEVMASFFIMSKSANLPAGMKIAQIFEVDASPRNIAHRLKKILLPFKVVPEHVQIFLNF